MPAETLFRLGFFIFSLSLFMALEAIFPRRKRRRKRWRRWATNFGLSFINTAALRLLGPVVAVSAAAWASGAGWGVFNIASIHPNIVFFVSVIALDLAVFGQHVATHKVPLLWRLHRVHHSDQDLDASSGLRFHPLEILLSMIYKCLMVIAIGPSVAAVISYEIALNGAALFNHANLALPKWMDRGVRSVLVTPDMHRVHHSVVRAETDSNYGNILSIWDKVFGTYTPQPKAGHDGMVIGLDEAQEDGPEKLLWSLRNPFSNQ